MNEGRLPGSCSINTNVDTGDIGAVWQLAARVLTANVILSASKGGSEHRCGPTPYKTGDVYRK